MRAVIVLTAVACVVGCGSKEHKRFANVAERANPTILELRPLASIVLATGGDLAAKNKACLAALAVARGLKIVGFDDSYGAKSDHVGVDDVLRSLEIDAPVDCADAKKGQPDEGCQEWCAKDLDLLADALRRFGDRARAEGVTIEPLVAP